MNTPLLLLGVVLAIPALILSIYFALSLDSKDLPRYNLGFLVALALLSGINFIIKAVTHG